METITAGSYLIKPKSIGPGYDTKINYFAVYEMDWLLKVINQKQRKRIISCLDENNRITFSELNEKLQLNKSFLLQHLRILRLAKIVIVEEDTKNKYYSLNHAHVAEVVSLLNKATLLNKTISDAKGSS